MNIDAEMQELMIRTGAANAAYADVLAEMIAIARDCAALSARLPKGDKRIKLLAHLTEEAKTLQPIVEAARDREAVFKAWLNGETREAKR